MNGMNTFEQSTGSSLHPGIMLRGRYRLENKLGQGGFGITYAALDTVSHQRVAIKELFPSRCVVRSMDQKTIQIQSGHESTFQHLQECFEKEAKVLMKLQNLEGIVRLMHVFSENNTVYYAMELLEGEVLISRLKREGVMRWDQLAPILKTIMKALEQIHAVGLIHRDISPDNIFLTNSGARLIDFGSVRNYQGETHLTALVKQNFAPWEQFLTTGHQGPWTDIYALSVTAYYALSGQLPPSALERRKEDKLIPLDHLCPNLPKDICAAIHHGMMVLPEKRFQSVQQFRHALKLDDGPIVQNHTKTGLVCLRGSFAGKVWHLQPDSMLRIGRNPECEIRYPNNFPGVSRAQCTVYRTKEGRYIVKDDHSSYGTRLTGAGKNVALEPGVWYAADGAHIIFAAQEEYVLMR